MIGRVPNFPRPVSNIAGAGLSTSFLIMTLSADGIGPWAGLFAVIAVFNSIMVWRFYNEPRAKDS